MGNGQGTYIFAVEEVKPKQWLELDIRPHDERAKEQYASVWHRMSLAVQEQHKMVPSPLPDWTKWKPQEWCRKPAGYERRQQYVAWAGPNLIGFLNLWPNFACTCQPGKESIYVEHLAAAPGNMDTMLWNQRFRYVGTALLAYAVQCSQKQGFEGRVSLHAADETALNFYRYINTSKCGGNLFFPERVAVEGPTPRGPYEVNKTYLETQEGAALEWLENYRSD